MGQAFAGVGQDAGEEVAVFYLGEDFRFVRANAAAEAQAGMGADELRGQHPTAIKPMLSRCDFDNLVAPLVAGRVPAIEFDTIHRAKHGGETLVRVRLEPNPAGGYIARAASLSWDRSLAAVARRARMQVDNVRWSMATSLRSGLAQLSRELEAQARRLERVDHQEAKRAAERLTYFSCWLSRVP